MAAVRIRHLHFGTQGARGGIEGTRDIDNARLELLSWKLDNVR